MAVKYDVNYTDRKYLSESIKQKIRNDLKDKSYNIKINEFLIKQLEDLADNKLSSELHDQCCVQIYSCYESFLNDRQKNAIIEFSRAIYQTKDHSHKTNLHANLTAINEFLK